MDESRQTETVTVNATIEHAQFWLSTAGQPHPASDGLIPDHFSDRIASDGIAVAVPTVEQWADIEVTMTLYSSRYEEAGAQYLGESTLEVIDAGLRCVDFHGTPFPWLPLRGIAHCTLSVWRMPGNKEAYKICVFPS
ncbi:hypothetical protein [Streptomyces sp. NPDC023838]|uniref:hypothetical protein n=1 Tax=Streptomyces sp. NPDC023838 TaxID=3154325 RepID=UPI0033E09E6D